MCGIAPAVNLSENLDHFRTRVIKSNDKILKIRFDGGVEHGWKLEYCRWDFSQKSDIDSLASEYLDYRKILKVSKWNNQKILHTLIFENL